MAITTDSYATNWVRVTDHERLRALVDRFAAHSEVCAGGANWRIDVGLGESVRISARDLSDGDLCVREENAAPLEFESALIELLEDHEVLVFHTMSWRDGQPYFSCRVHADGQQFEMTNTDLIEHAADLLSFPTSKVVL